MPLAQYVLTVSTSSVLLLGILELLRRRQLKEKYAVLWLLVGVTVFVLAVFPQLLGWIAGTANVAVPVNLLFFLAIVLLLCVCIHLSWESSRQEERIRVLAEESALLRQRIECLEERALGSADRTSTQELER